MNTALQNYIEFLKKLSFYLKENYKVDPLPFVYKTVSEVYIPDIKKIKQKKNKKEHQKYSFINHEELEDNLKLKKEYAENIFCNRCKNKVYGVKQYFKKPIRGPKPILVLHYNGSIDNKKLPKDNSDKFYFSSQEEDEMFNRMLATVNLSLENLYFMEFVACHFSPDSTREEWDERVQNCLIYLEKIINEYNIEKLLIVGNSAILLFGKDAFEFVKRSEIKNISICNKMIPSLIIRSPLALLTIEEKRKEYYQKLIQYQEEYKLYLKYKDQLDTLLKDIIDLIPQNQNVKIINNVKLISASQLKSEKEIEKDIQKFLGNGKYILYKALKFRKEEINIKQQILNSLKLLLH